MLLLGDMVGARRGAVARPGQSRGAGRPRGQRGGRAWRDKIAEKPKRTLTIGKEAFYRQLEMPLEEAYAYASKVMVENMLDAEAEEGIGAFIEKRKPRWPR